VVRWEPDARGRLQSAALDLYVSRGYEQTTVAEIARSVGLTERTFFRHFADKREVLFDGQHLFQQAFLDGIAAAAANATPLEMIASALAVSAQPFSDERRLWSRRRQAVIAANPALQEREQLKLAALVSAVAEELRNHAVPEPTATLAAHSCVTVFEVAFAQWIAEGEDRSLIDIEHEALAELASLATELKTGGGPRFAHDPWPRPSRV
jgi:AcrR family transcriptional regulator